MSEFSDCYHIRAHDTAEGVALLRRAGLTGFVFPAAGGWVTLVADGEPFAPNRPLIAATPGVLLHYMSGEDHGWGFELYRDGRLVSRYDCDWLRGFKVVVEELDLPVMNELLGEGFRALGDEDRRRIFHPGERHREIFPAETFAEAVGLTWFSDLTHDSVHDNFEDGWADEGAIEVN
jgi:hypothetical protein